MPHTPRSERGHRSRLPAFLLSFALLAAPGSHADVLLATGVTDRELAEHYAPVLYQDVADGLFNDPWNYRRDFITNVDFDGDHDATNNLENLDSGAHPLRAFVYFDVVETQTHFYIAYSFFHPDDWNFLGFTDHENDLENQRVVVEKDGSAFGLFVLTDFNSHGFHIAYTDRPDVGPGSMTLSSRFRPGGLEFEDAGGLVSDDFSPVFSHVRVYIEPQGHGPASCVDPVPPLGFLNGINCDAIGGTDKVVYRVSPGAGPGMAVEPDIDTIDHGIEHPVVPYVLLNGSETLWPERQQLEGEPGAQPLWDQSFHYDPGRNADANPHNDMWLRPEPALRLGSEFAGDEGGGQGRPVWGFESDAPGLHTRGDWILDPAWSTAIFYEIPGEAAPGFCTYLHNPLLEELLIVLPRDCNAGPPGCGGGSAAVGGLMLLRLARRTPRSRRFINEDKMLR